MESTLSHRRSGTSVAVSIPTIALAALALFFAWKGVHMADEYYNLVRLTFQPHVRDLGGSDFPAFYGGARLLLEDPGNAYDPASQGAAIAQAKGQPFGSDSPWHRYYNPPTYSLLLAPLTLFDLHTAYGLALLANAAALGLLLGVLFRILRHRRVVFFFLTAAVLTSHPVNYAFWHAQPTMFLAALLGLVYLWQQESRPLHSGFVWAGLLLKPHWLASPLLGQHQLTRLQAGAAAAGGAILCLPFLLTGPGGMADYASLLLGRGTGDISDESFSEAVLSWPGFLRGLTGEPQTVATMLLVAFTVALYGAVRARGRIDALPLAGAMTLLLVVPHSHPQDWIMLVPGAAILLASQTRIAESAVTAALLLGIYLGIEQWSAAQDRSDMIYWPTLFGFGVLAWALLLGWISRNEAQPATAASRGYGAAAPRSGNGG